MGIQFVEDTSFLVSVMSQFDNRSGKYEANHGLAVSIMRDLKKYRNVEVFIPSLVIFETTFCLIRKGYGKAEVKSKIDRLLKTREISFMSLETDGHWEEFVEFGVEIINSYSRSEQPFSKTADNMIAHCAKKQDAWVLTFDNDIKKICKRADGEQMCFLLTDQNEKTRFDYLLQEFGDKR